MTHHYIAALDIGGTKIAATIASQDGPLLRLTCPTPKSGAPGAVAEQAIALLDSVCQQSAIEPETISAVGVSTCGPFSILNGARGLAAPNICGKDAGRADLPNDWDVIPFESILRARFPDIVIEIDCVAALIAERTFGALRDEPDCIYATWSTGVGFGLCVDGHILRGKNGNAGHAGHMLMDLHSPAICGCGNNGDLEAMISGRNIAHHAGRSSTDLFAAAKAGEPLALKAVTTAAQWFGRALYNLTVSLDTRSLAIGGSVWMHHGQWLAPIVQEQIEQRMPILTRNVSLTSATLGIVVTDIGALSMVMPANWIQEWRNKQAWLAIDTDKTTPST